MRHHNRARSSFAVLPLSCALTALALGACSPGSGSSSRGETIRRAAVAGVGVTIDPGGFRGTMCFGGGGCVYGETIELDVPDGAHPITAAHTYGLADTSSSLGTLTVNKAAGTIVLDSPHFTPAGPATWRALTSEPIGFVSSGYPGQLTIYGQHVLRPTTTVRLLRNRRYHLSGDYGWRVPQMDNFFSAAPDLEVRADGSVAVVAGSEAAALFAASGTTLSVRAENLVEVSLERNGYPGGLQIYGQHQFLPGSTVKLLRSRRYFLWADWTWRAPPLENHFSSAPDLDIDADGRMTIVSGAGAASTFTTSGATLVVRPEALVELRYQPNGFVGTLHVLGMHTFSPGSSVRLLRGRRYHLMANWSWRTPELDGYFSTHPDLEVDTDGTVRLVAGSGAADLYTVEGTTLTIPLTNLVEVNYQPNGYVGTVHIVGQHTFSPGSSARLLKNRRYHLMANWSWRHPQLDGYFSAAPDLEVTADGTVRLTPGAQANDQFVVNGTTLTIPPENLVGVTFQPNGFAGAMHIIGQHTFSEGSTARLLRGRRYHFYTNWSWRPAQLDGYLSTEPDLEVGLDRTVRLVPGTTATTQLAVAGTAVSIPPENLVDVTYEANGYTAAVYIIGQHTFSPGSAAKLLRGRRYHTYGAWSWRYPQLDGYFSSSPDLEVGADGAVTMVAGTDGATQFEIRGRELTVRSEALVDVSYDPNGTVVPVVVQGQHTFTPGSVARLLRNRRYTLYTDHTWHPVTSEGAVSREPDLELRPDGTLAFVPGTDAAAIFYPTGAARFATTAGTLRVESAYTGQLCVNRLACRASSGPVSVAVIPGRKYRIDPGSVEVVFQRGGGCTPATATVGGSPTSFFCEQQAPPGGPLVAPERLSAVAVSGERIDLTWSLVSVNQTGVRAERSEDGGTSWTAVAGCDLGPLATACSDLGPLVKGRTYRYRVYAHNLAWRIDSAPAIVDFRGPAAPGALVATIRSRTQVDLTWSDLSDNEQAFVVERSVNGGAFGEVVRLGPGARAHSDAGLPAATYAYRVRAENRVDFAATAPVTVVLQAPAAPTGLTAALAGQRRIDLAWTAMAGTETGFRVLRSTDGVSFTSLPDLAASARAFSDGTVTPGNTYSYRVVAFNALWTSELSNVASVAVFAPPAPVALRAEVVSGTRITLIWGHGMATPTTGARQGHRLERSLKDANAFGPVPVTIGASATTANDDTAAAGTNYDYRLVATNFAGDSGASNLASSRLGGAQLPANFAARVASTSRVELSWTDVVNETSYQVQISTTSATTGFTTLNPSPTQNQTSHAATGLSTSPTYWFRVRAINQAGSSAYVTIGGLRTGTPSVPSNLRLAVLSGSRIRLDWNDNSTNENGFHVQRSTASTFPTDPTRTFLFTVGVGVRTFTDTGLAAQTRYWYRVRAFNGSNATSAFTASVNGTTQTLCTNDPDGTLCAGNICSGTRCLAGSCSAPRTLDCGDGNACTVDTCDPTQPEAQACRHSNAIVGTSCANADRCDGGESCGFSGTGSFACLPGTPVTCDDSNSCTRDTCEPSTGACSSAADPAREGQACGGVGMCGAQVCQAGVCQDDQATCGVTPLLTCVSPTDTGYTAVWGYRNTAANAVTVAAGGPSNRFEGPRPDLGQPSVFEPADPPPAVVPEAFTTEVTGTAPVTWRLGALTASASPASTPCTFYKREDCAEGMVRMLEGCFPEPSPMTGLSLDDLHVGTTMSGGYAVHATPGALTVDDDGAAAYAISIEVPPGVLAPSLTTHYNSRFGDGVMGIGWRLAGDVISEISRCPQSYTKTGATRAVSYGPGDQFCLDGVPLAATAGSYGGDGTTYYLERHNFSQVRSFSPDAHGPTRFEVRTKDGRTMVYQEALPGVARQTVANPDGTLSTRPIRVGWHLTSIEDRAGNRLVMSYVGPPAGTAVEGAHEVYLDRISYRPVGYPADTRYISFVYIDRSMPASVFVSGTEHRFGRILGDIELHAGATPNPGVVRRYRFRYRHNGGFPSALETIDQCDADGVCDRPTRIELTPYTNRSNYPTASTELYAYQNSAEYGIADHRIGDLNGDGFPDLLYLQYSPLLTSWYYRLNDGTGRFNPPELIQANDGGSWTIWQQYRYVGGQGIVDIETAYLFKSPNVRTFDLVDIDGNGTSDIVGAWARARCEEKNPRVARVQYERRRAVFEGGRTFAYDTLPNLAGEGGDDDDRLDGLGAVPCGVEDPETPISRVADLNGDGFPDFLRTRMLSTTATKAAWFVRLNNIYRSVERNVPATGSWFDGSALVRAPEGTPPSGIVTTGDGTAVMAATGELKFFSELLDIDGDGAAELLQAAPTLAGEGTRGQSETVQYFAHSFAGLAREDVTGEGAGRLVSVKRRYPTGLFTRAIRRGERGEKVMNASPITWADLNGDGLRDAILQPECGEATFHVQFNRGGVFAPPVAMSSSVGAVGLGARRGSCDFANSEDLSNVPLVGDIDLDGREDLVLVNEGRDLTNNVNHRAFAGILIWDGQNTFVEHPTRTPSVATKYARHQLVDMNDDGRLELIVERNRRVEQWTLRGERPNLLGRITDGRGAISTPRYDNIGVRGRHTPDFCKNTIDGNEYRLGQRCLTSGPWVVYQHTVQAEGMNKLFSHHYAGARVDTTGHGWLGFRQSRHFDGARSVTRSYDQRAYYGYLLDGTSIRRAWRMYPLAGALLKEVRTTDLGDRRRLTATRDMFHFALREASTAESTAPAWSFPAVVADEEYEEVWSARDQRGVVPPARTIATKASLTSNTIDQTHPQGRQYGNLGNTESLFTTSKPAVGAFPYGDQDDAGWTSTVAPFLTLVSTLIRDTPGDRVTTTRNYFAPNVARWAVGLPESTSVLTVGARGDRERHTTHWEYDPATLLLNKKISEKDAGPTRELTEDIIRDPRNAALVGTVRTSGGGVTRSVFTTYDTFGGGTRAVVRNAKDHVEQFFHSPRLGALMARVDANGNVTRWIRDGFGMEQAELRGPGDRTDVSYTYRNADERLIVRRTESNGTWAETETNNRSLVVQTRRPRFGGGVVTETTQYHDVFDLPTRRDTSGDATAAPVASTWLYDEIGRPVSRSRGSGSSTIEYDGLTETITRPAEGNRRAKVVTLSHDYLGRLVSVAEPTDDTLEAAASRPAAVTEYRYGTGKNVREILLRGPQQMTPTVEESIEYEGETGRRQSVTTLSSGYSRFTWNAFGEMVTDERARHRDATGAERQTTTHGYDELGRRTSLEVGGRTATWVWDRSARGKGLLSSATSLDGVVTTHGYEGRGWLHRKAWQHQTSTHGLRFNHDALGRIQSINYPRTCDGVNFTTLNRYDDGPGATGLLVSVAQVGTSRTFWRALERDPRNVLRRVGLDYRGDVPGITQAYERVHPERVTRIHTRVGTAGASFQDLRFSYLASGRLRSRADEVFRESEETFAYDPLDRLESWTATGGDFSVSFGYDLRGNPTNRNLTADGGNELITYRHDDAARPHLVTSRVLDGATTLGSYGHDWRGNRTVTPDRIIDYTSFDLPATIRDAGGQPIQSYLYDADNARFRRQSADGADTTLTVGGLFERRGTTNVYYITAETGLVAQVECPDQAPVTLPPPIGGGGGLPGPEDDTVRFRMPGKATYFGKDHQGSVTSVMEVLRSGATVLSIQGQQQAFDPFGNLVERHRPSLVTPPTTSIAGVRPGYTGHDGDRELGFVNMNGRIYDPGTARFLTADPVAGTGRGSQAINRYAYLTGDPMNATDPSGFTGESSYDGDYEDIRIVQQAPATPTPVYLNLDLPSLTLQPPSFFMPPPPPPPSYLPQDTPLTINGVEVKYWARMSISEYYVPNGQLLAADDSPAMPAMLGGDLPGAHKRRGCIGGRCGTIITFLHEQPLGYSPGVDIISVILTGGGSLVLRSVGPAASSASGGFSRLRGWWMRGSENDAAWRALSLRDKFFYELGQKTMSNREFKAFGFDLGNLDAVGRGRVLWQEQGFRSLFSSYGNLPATWSTGPTPAVRYVLPRMVIGGGIGAGTYWLLSE